MPAQSSVSQMCGYARGPPRIRLRGTMTSRSNKVTSRSRFPTSHPCTPEIAAAALFGWPYSSIPYPDRFPYESRGTLTFVMSPNLANSWMN